jgi:hypothetical protein
MELQKVKRYLPYTILILSILTVNPYSRFSITNMATVWILELWILFLYYSISTKLFKNHYLNNMTIIVVYLIYTVFSFFRGLYIAEFYWDYKSLFNNGLALFLPIVAFSGTSPSFLKVLLQFYLKYTLPLLLVFFFFISHGAVGFFLVPISFLVLFLPVIKKPWNIYLLLLSLFVVFLGLGARSNVIKVLVPILFSLIYYIKIILNLTILEFLRKLLFIFPLVFFLLAIVGSFNVFKINKYVEGNFKSTNKNVFTGKEETEDLTSDTRTPLYVEVLFSAKKNNSWLLGRSPARGSETKLFRSLSKITGRQERSGNEVAILNIFTWTGIVGVVFYFLIFYKASYLAINFSNNIFSKILGLFIGFRWCYAWVEDINYFTLTTFFLWIMIGLCFSKSFRGMNDKEVTDWINGIFERPKYLRKIHIQ